METVEIVDCAFNNRGFPRQPLRDVNWNDYQVRDIIKPDLLQEQERWFFEQLFGFRKIFSKKAGYNSHSPTGVSGTITARKIEKLEWIASFTHFCHGAVPFICAMRNYTGEVLRIRLTSKTLAHASVHLTPAAFSDRYNDGDWRKEMAQTKWHRGMRRLRLFAKNQILAGRDYVILAGDYNARAWRVRNAFGETIAGKKVHIFTSPHGYNIDHIVVIGDVRKLKSDILKTKSDHAAFWVRMELL